MKKTISFQQPSQRLSNTRKIAWVFPFVAVDTALIGSPEEKSETTPHHIVVSASYELIHAWGFMFVLSFEENDRVKQERHNLMKIMFEYGRRQVIQKLKDAGKIDTEETVELNTSNTSGLTKEFCPDLLP